MTNIGTWTKVGCWKNVQQILGSRTKSRTKTSTLSKKYNRHLEIIFKYHLSSEHPRQTPSSKSTIFQMSYLGLKPCKKS